MTVQSDILDLIKERFVNEAVTASMIAELKGLSRNTVSHHLNRLVDENFLIKMKEKPTRFRLNDPKKRQDAFNIIGYEGSMREIIKQCKAAVTYPKGLPIILNGPSGTGKSFIAKVIHAYAKETGHIAANAPFCVLNCADYANNPELLSSVLFGHIKGAFTGAEKEKRGLLDEADGGYLFLDEVHNLSAENQEKLFILIDSGRFRRLGDNESWIKTNVRLVMATTEDPRSSMLTTFRRRIPYEVVLPKYLDRPYNERLDLVKNFFMSECKAIQRKIMVDNVLLEHLARTDYDGNVGELKNKIKVLVANELPNCQVGDIKIPIDMGSHFSIFDPESQTSMGKYLSTKNDDLHDRLAKIKTFSQLVKHSDEIGYLAEEICNKNKETEERIDFLSSSYGGFCSMTREYFRMFGYLPENQMIQQLKKIMMFLIDFGYEMKQLPLTTTTEKVEYRKYSQMARGFVQKLFYQHPLMEQFSTLTAAYLSTHFPIETKINAVVIMHGKNNAATVAATANEMIGNFVFDYFDMPLTVNTGEIIKKIVNYSRQIDTNLGLVILVDMGSLEKIYRDISGNVIGDLIVMNNTSTALATEVGMKLLQNTSIKELEKMDMASFAVNKKYFEGVSQKPNILVACMSGEGIAVKIRDILVQYISEKVDVITIDYNLLKEKVEKTDEVFFKNTISILTTPKMDSEDLPVISIEEIIGNQSALDGLSTYIPAENTKNIMTDILKFFTIEGAASRLSFLNPERVINEVGEVIDSYEEYYKLEFPNFVRINLFLHLSSMIERILKYGESQEESGFTPPKTVEFQSFCDFSDLVFQSIKEKYNILIPVTEYGLVYQLVQQSMKE